MRSLLSSLVQALTILALSQIAIGQRRRINSSPAAQVLLSSCPRSLSCVGRHFCDDSGAVTRTRNNRLRFGDDTRGLVNCVDKRRNRLGVCCFDRKHLSILNRRRIRQDQIQINEEGVLGLDTTLQDDQSDEVLINEDLLSDIFTGQVDSFEDDRSIEDIINQVEAELDETSSIIMMKDNGVSGKDVAVRFPEISQGGEIQGSNPVVVINIRADNVDLDENIPGLRESERTKQVKINDDFSPGSGPAVDIDQDLLRELETEIMTMLTEEERRRKEEEPLDFNTDVITITMDSDLSDITSRPWQHGRRGRGRTRLIRPSSSLSSSLSLSSDLIRPRLIRPGPLFRRVVRPREIFYPYQ